MLKERKNIKNEDAEWEEEPSIEIDER